jgi:hypothetical protein
MERREGKSKPSMAEVLNVRKKATRDFDKRRLP